MKTLNTVNVNCYFMGYTNVTQTGNSFKQEIPAPTVNIPKPLSYEFRVAEHADGKVGLQTRVWEHDNYGQGFLVQDWTAVERVKV